MAFEAGTYVWVPDDVEQALPCKVLTPFKSGEAGKVLTDDGEEMDISTDMSAKVTACDPEVLDSKIDNLIALNDLNENAILHNLRIRFKQDIIYTNVSSICISVNPFKLLPIYTPEIMDKYRENSRSLPPHVFKIADDSYRGMLSERQDQAVIISGESGAGKSEATKLMLQYITDIASRTGGTKQTADESKGGSLEQQILQANPIMEAFGNAKTVRNNNSSRFGKLITIKFESNGGICGGSIINYLLEKSRVVFQANGERNYHVFYQLCAGGKADPALQAAVQTTDPQDYHYLDQSGVVEIEGMNDEKEFSIVRRGFDTLGMDNDSEVLPVLKTVAAVLHLGNIQFEVVQKAMEEDSSAISNPAELDICAALLGIDAAELNKNLTSKNIGTRSVILVQYDVEKAQEARDALVKAVYGNLFQYIIDRINRSLAEGATSDNPANIIGVLDIFGFESFETGNSFEQLCINFCNEKLQFHFNEHIFRLEQEVYAAEGVDVPRTDFKDNQPTLDLLEAKGTGIFPMTDEEINVPRGTDLTLLSKLQSKHDKNPQFSARAPAKAKVPDAANCFGVVHYAGVVYYNITNFLEKNKDQLTDDLKKMVQASAEPFVAGLIKEAEAPAEKSKVRSRGGGKKSSTKTLGGQFKSSLNSLMTTLNAASPQFVRCMKPNKQKVGGVFEADMMIAQLRYSGLLEVCRIRKLGYPVRRDKTDYIKRYAVCCAGATELDAINASLSEQGVLKEGQWAVGTSKMFMKNRQAQELEEAREAAIAETIVKIQSLIRSAVFKFRYRRCIKTISDLKEAIKARDEEKLIEKLDMFTELPHGGKHLPVYAEAKELLVRLTEERQTVQLLETAIAARNKESLKSAVKKAADMTPPFEHALIGTATELVARIEKEEEVIAGLKKAMAARDRAQLVELLTQATEMELEADEVRQGEALKLRLEEEEATIDSIKEAIAARNLNNLTAFLSKASEMGLSGDVIAEGTKLQDQLKKEQAAAKQLSEAINKRDLDVINAAIAKAESVGLAADAKELTDAKALKATIENELAILAKLKAACEARDESAIDAALAEASGAGLAGKPEMEEAQHVKESLAAEAAAIEACKAAVASGDSAALTAAQSEASKLGLSGPEVKAVTDAIEALEAAASGTKKLEALAGSDSIDKIKAAMTEADGLGLSGAPEYAACAARVKALEEEKALIAEMVAATAGGDAKAISKAVATAMKMGIANKYAAEMKAAKDKVAQLDAGGKVAEAIPQAIASKDLVALEAALAKAAECNYTGPEVAEGEAAKVTLAKEAAIDEELEAGLAAAQNGDKAPLQAAYEKAKALGMSSDRVQQAGLVLDREKLVNDTYAEIDKATETKDLVILQKALETAIKLGLTGPKIDAAGELREALQAVVDEMDKVRAATTVLKEQMTSAGGIKPSDVAVLASAVEAAESTIVGENMSASIKAELDDAKQTVENGTLQLTIQDELNEVKKTPNDHAALKAVIAKAASLEGLSLTTLDEVRALFKAADLEYQAAREGVDAPEEPEEEVDTEEQARRAKERHDRAKHPKFRFQVYPGLRTPDDFAKNVILQKRKLKDGMLKWTANLIPKSLLDLDAESSKMSIQIHKALLGYMGDKAMSFPATLAQDILEKGLQNLRLRDEIYMQIMKQLTSNPTADSIAKGWQVMCMCVSTFPPSSEFEDYLLNFMLVQKEKKGAVKNYARYCLRTLEGMLSSGASGFVPSVEEIQAYKERPPILATVELVDGNTLTEELPVTPDLNVGKVVEICTHFMELVDERCENMGIFVYDLARDESIPDPDAEKPFAKLERTPRPLRNEDFMGDIIVQKARQKRNYKFVFKRKIFLPSHNTPSDDVMFNRLIYLQAEDEVINLGNLPIADEATAVDLATLSYAVAYEADFPDDPTMLATDPDYLVKDFIPLGWRERKSVEEYAAMVVAARDKVCGADFEPAAMQQTFLEKVWNHDLYGAHFFNVIVLSCGLSMPTDLRIAFNHSGMWVFDMDYNKKHSFGYADIYRWGGSSSQFSLIIWNTASESTFELKLATAQAADMAGIILDYINAIMQATQEQG